MLEVSAIPKAIQSLTREDILTLCSWVATVRPDETTDDDLVQFRTYLTSSLLSAVALDLRSRA